ncbi:MAG TPA: hypothetical protein IGQ44_01465 [Geminocystis sp. M7585_C2015_104]|nr:hypothetical protein [Geminocystis sp. M7585_C2015_104]
MCLSFLWLNYPSQKINPTPFIVASFFADIFAFSPHFAFQQLPKTFPQNYFFPSLFAATIATTCLALILIAVLKGDWQVYLFQKFRLSPAFSAFASGFL